MVGTVVANGVRLKKGGGEQDEELIATLMTLIVLSIAAVPAVRKRATDALPQSAQARYDDRYDNRRYRKTSIVTKMTGCLG